MTDYISRADAIEAVRGLSALVDDKDFSYFEDALKALPSADAVPIHEDGTLEVKVPNAQKVGRVLVMDTDSHIGGGLFYPDDADAEFADRPKGDWIRHELWGNPWFTCSECNYHGRNDFNYCPNCGADMRGNK